MGDLGAVEAQGKGLLGRDFDPAGSSDITGVPSVWLAGSLGMVSYYDGAGPSPVEQIRPDTWEPARTI